jgi:hypothetical protein
MVAGCASGCSAQPEQDEGAIQAAVSFVTQYDSWAQSGYAEPIPVALRDAASLDMQSILEDDQDWYLTGGIRQHGAVKIVKADLTTIDSHHAIVTITLNAGGVSVTARGEGTFVDYSEPIVTQFHLERKDNWLITSTTSEE